VPYHRAYDGAENLATSAPLAPFTIGMRNPGNALVLVCGS